MEDLSPIEIIAEDREDTMDLSPAADGTPSDDDGRRPTMGCDAGLEEGIAGVREDLAQMGALVKPLGEQARGLSDDVAALGAGIAELKDLFVRRLYDDRQKGELMRTLEGQARFAFVEPFLHDLILLLDRLDRADDEFSVSVRDELLDILQRRGVERMAVTKQFDPSLHRAVRVTQAEPGAPTGISAVIRHGYTHDGKVVRPAEVVVARGARRQPRKDA